MTCPYYGLFENRALIIAVIVLIVMMGALLFQLRAEVLRRRTLERKLRRTPTMYECPECGCEVDTYTSTPI